MPIFPQAPRVPTLKVRARGNALVQDLARMENEVRPVRAYVGWVFDHELAALGGGPGWRHKLEDTVIEYRHEYVRDVGEGMLWPADEETAALCNVAFDPDFGGELAEIKTFLGEREAAKKAGEEAAKKLADEAKKKAETALTQKPPSLAPVDGAPAPAREGKA